MNHTLRLMLLMVLTITACQNQIQEKPKVLTAAATDMGEFQIALTPDPEPSDTLTIEEKSAVFFQPDSLQIERRKKKAGETDFYAGADDYIFYMNSALQFLDSVKLKTVEARDKKFLRFVGRDASQQLIRIDTLPELWGMFFFEPSKTARLANVLDIDQSYSSYYK
jgi:hypothetical protein